MGDDLNTEIQELALAAQCHSSGSRERRKAITKLHQLMMRPGVLNYPPTRSLRPPFDRYFDLYFGLYKEIWHNTRTDILAKIYTTIDTYNPSRASFVGYVQFLASRRVRDQVERYQYLQHEVSYQKFLKSDDSTDHNQEPPIPNSEVQSDRSLSESEMLCQYIEEDPEGLLRENCMRAYPHVTLQAVMVRHIILGQTYQEIATDLGVTSLSSLTEFYRRKLKPVIPRICKYWQDHGSEMD